MTETPTTAIRVGAPGAGGDADAAPSLRADEVFAPPSADEFAGKSPLDGLRGALQAPVESEPILLRVPGRPGVTIRCHTKMTQEERIAWQRRSTPKKRTTFGQDPKVDEMQFACLVLANTCEAVLFNGQEAHDPEHGTVLSFRSQGLWEMVGATEPQQAIRKFFGKDPHVLIASGEVMLASGFDDDLEEGADPTEV